MPQGTKEDPWVLRTPPGSSQYTIYRDDAADPPALVCQVGSTKLTYRIRAIEDLHGWLCESGEWVPLGAADENKPAADGTVEAWGRAATNPVGGWYGLRKGYRGRFAMYLPPLLEALGLAELTHEPRNNKMRAISRGSSQAVHLLGAVDGALVELVSSQDSKSSEGSIMASGTVVRYTTSRDAGDENERLIRSVIEELAIERPAGLGYCALRLSDGVGFVHLALLADAANNPLTDLETFKRFASTIGERCTDGPHAATGRLIGAYGFRPTEGDRVSTSSMGSAPLKAG